MFYLMSCVCTANLHSTGGTVEWEQAAYPTRRPVSGVVVLMYCVELPHSCLHITWNIRLHISVLMCMERYLGQSHTEIDNPPQASIHLASMDDDLLPTAHLICPRGPGREVTAGKHVMLARRESARRRLEGR